MEASLAIINQVTDVSSQSTMSENGMVQDAVIGKADLETGTQFEAVPADLGSHHGIDIAQGTANGYAPLYQRIADLGASFHGEVPAPIKAPTVPQQNGNGQIAV